MKTKPTLSAAIAALRLPTTYKPLTTVEGTENGTYTKLLRLHSGTGGHNTVWAIYTHNGGWMEINQSMFAAHVNGIIG